MRKDLVKHVQAGFAAALFGVLYGLVSQFVYQMFGIEKSCLSVASDAFLCSLVAGIAKEANDFIENRLARLAGLQEPHECSGWDLLATTGPGAAVAVAVIAACKFLG